MAWFGSLAGMWKVVRRSVLLPFSLTGPRRRYNWLQGGIKDFFVRPSCHECAKVWDYVKQFKENNRKINEVCREISERHLIRIEKKTVYRDHDFKDLQEKHRHAPQPTGLACK